MQTRLKLNVEEYDALRNRVLTEMDGGAKIAVRLSNYRYIIQQSEVSSGTTHWTT